MIRAKILLACLAVLALPGMASAQSSFFGTLKCQRSSPPPAGASSIDPTPTTRTVNEKCLWTVPLQVAADTPIEGQNTFSMQVQGDESKDTGTHVSRMANSDQFTMNLTGGSILSSRGSARSREGKWAFAGGTGALKGIVGNGTYMGLASADGGMTYDVEGTYEIPNQAPASKDP